MTVRRRGVWRVAPAWGILRGPPATQRGDVTRSFGATARRVALPLAVALLAGASLPGVGRSGDALLRAAVEAPSGLAPAGAPGQLRGGSGLLMGLGAPVLLRGGALPLSTGLRVPAADLPSTPSAPAPQVARAARGVTDAERRGLAALAALDWPHEELGWTIRFEPYRGRYLGLADARTRTIRIFVKRGEVEGELRTTIAHELGHALDATVGTEESRAAYRAVRGIAPDVPWYPCHRCADLGSPAGDFAETFARWLVGPAHVRRTLAPAPDAAQLRELGRFFAPLSARGVR